MKKGLSPIIAVTLLILLTSTVSVMFVSFSRPLIQNIAVESEIRQKFQSEQMDIGSVEMQGDTVTFGVRRGSTLFTSSNPSGSRGQEGALGNPDGRGENPENPENPDEGGGVPQEDGGTEEVANSEQFLQIIFKRGEETYSEFIEEVPEGNDAKLYTLDLNGKISDAEAIDKIEIYLGVRLPNGDRIISQKLTEWSP